MSVSVVFSPPKKQFMSQSLYLSPEEARILGVLVEKAITMPDHYPLSAKALLGGCNQKHARNPVMDISEAQLSDCLPTLIELGLVELMPMDLRYRHRLDTALDLNKAELCLLSLLLLRGSLSSNELFQRSEHLFTFSGVPHIEKTLNNMAGNAEFPSVLKVENGIAEGESQWMHTLSVVPGFPRMQMDLVDDLLGSAEESRTQRKVLELEKRVQELEDIIALLSTDPGRNKDAS